MRHHLQPQIRSPGSKKEPGETVAVGIFPPDEAEDYAMSDDFHSETRDSECQDAGRCRSDGNDVLQGKDPDAFPEIKFSFSLYFCHFNLRSAVIKQLLNFIKRCFLLKKYCQTYF